MQHLDYFGCPHPILAVAMNRVSDVNLAVAVLQAGAFPSISSFNYYRNGALDYRWFGEELDRFRQLAGGSTQVLVSLATEDFLSSRLQTLLIDRGFRFVELFNWEPDAALWRRLKTQISYLQTWYGLKVVFKIHRAQDAIELGLSTVVFKGNEGAGRTVPEAGSLEENFRHLRQAMPSLAIIPSGGIATPEQVKHFIDRGALAVGIGTLFAAAEESCVSRQTKLRMIEAGAADIAKFGKLNHRGLVFGNVGPDDSNNTRSLLMFFADPT
ncbi:MAG: nitronate monooxygenase, partial [Reyranellaceae bacterium]